MEEPSQNQQSMALDERNRSPSMTDGEPSKCPQPSEAVGDHASLYSSPRCWEIPAELVTINKVVGRGAFGQVAKAKVRGLQGRPTTTLAAVKMLKENASESDRKDLLSELQLMKELDAHPHVVKLLGCVTKSGPLMVLIEYVPYGDLLGYMRKSRGLNDTYFQDPDIKPKTNLTSEQLMKFAWQVADGMSYLSSIPIIHRDLAARNVLVGEEEMCKVSDFGMARDGQQDKIYQMRSKGRIPLKWTAFEALLYGKYSSKSDVYDIMTNCWKDDPDLRPSFENLKDELKEMEDQHKVETLIEEPGSDLWYWTVFIEKNGGAGWSHPSSQSTVYAVCDIASKNEEPKNWLLTEYIYIKGATRLNIEVTYSLLNCPLASVGPFCRTNFTLYSYHTDYKLDYVPDPTNLKFQKETVIAPDTLPAPDRRTIDTFRGSIVTKAKIIYLALLDQGACLTISKFVVRYRFCSETAAALVKFPRTVAPPNNINSTNHEGECTDPHSLKRNNQKIFGVCLSNGEWNITSSSACLCNYGYELTNGSSDSFVCKG
ncbi:Proto-oncogene tyrosine-protein kinase receptor Ret [Stylophora pistillata]|uniref:Proto-oncogene tyrosine-protein kinase receptor Ret n=1 Tax=Stylophora pistillata TaxID=50429 RepID=A0A2B4R226_STYPI|nr:Proto-oncogene tyrosine-protein kinase receptor Ret [Stylophora pistillata]